MNAVPCRRSAVGISRCLLIRQAGAPLMAAGLLFPGLLPGRTMAEGLLRTAELRRVSADLIDGRTACLPLYSNMFWDMIVQTNGVEGESHGLELFMDYDVTSAWRARAEGSIMKQNTWHVRWEN